MFDEAINFIVEKETDQLEESDEGVTDWFKGNKHWDNGILVWNDIWGKKILFLLPRHWLNLKLIMVVGSLCFGWLFFYFHVKFGVFFYLFYFEFFFKIFILQYLIDWKFGFMIILDLFFIHNLDYEFGKLVWVDFNLF
jgi:hypothetical protein